MSPAHEQIIAALRESEMTPSALAVRAGVHENTVFRVLRGKDAHYSTLAAIAGALGLSSLPTR